MELFRVPAAGRGVCLHLTTLHVVVSPGHDAEPVLTVMLPHED